MGVNDAWVIFNGYRLNTELLYLWDNRLIAIQLQDLDLDVEDLLYFVFLEPLENELFKWNI